MASTLKPARTRRGASGAYSALLELAWWEGQDQRCVAAGRRPVLRMDLHAIGPGDPLLAREITALLGPAHAALDEDSWGLDHGSWSVLAPVFPQADVPVVQLSLHAEEPPEVHIELGRKLAPLRERRVLIAASGNIVHNLRRMNPAHSDSAYDWAERFDAKVSA